ncbi:MAG: U32 family peptidase [Lentisphaeria bacterium]|nr:U32 family peptidase [Lentisphaeria bacterium]
MSSLLRKMELLAPAGNLETAVAAFRAGADAVYLGLGKFNARNRAENFDQKSLAKLLDFAHSLKKKVYLTLNTLITEQELPELFTQIAAIAQLPLDAVIVQDLGVLYILRRYFPHITVHASTQMNIHNSCGIKLLEHLGVKRVILERQITLEELTKISQSTTMELEVFIHGSLCLSLSGRCLLSNYAEKASGNRGMCRQLCRRNYKTSENAPIRAALSPRDMQCMELLPKLAELNIASLKIEGRLRGPDYVVPVVKAYRQALDGLPEISGEALTMIRRTISRPTSSGAYHGFDRMLDKVPQAVFGCNVGVIKSCGRNGLTVLLTGRIHLGDKLRVVTATNASIAGFELTEILLNGKSCSSANSGKLVTIPGKYPFMEGENHLYKIGENGYDHKRQAASLAEALQIVPLALELDDQGLHISSPMVPEFEFHSESFAAAQRCSVTADDLQSVFSTASGQWRGEVKSVKISGEWFIPKSVLKDLKKELFTALLPHLKAAGAASAQSRAMLKFQRDHRSMIPAAQTLHLPENTLHIPGFIAEGDLEKYRNIIRQAARQNCRSFAVGSLHGFMLLKEALGLLKDIDIYAVYPLAAANSQAVKLLEYLKCKAVMPWVELPSSAKEKLFEHSTLPLLDLPEKCELLATRIPLKDKVLLDKNQQRYHVEYDPDEKLYKLYGDSDALKNFAGNDIY